MDTGHTTQSCSPVNDHILAAKDHQWRSNDLPSPDIPALTVTTACVSVLFLFCYCLTTPTDHLVDRAAPVDTQCQASEGKVLAGAT